MLQAVLEPTSNTPVERSIADIDLEENSRDTESPEYDKILSRKGVDTICLSFLLLVFISYTWQSFLVYVCKDEFGWSHPEVCSDNKIIWSMTPTRLQEQLLRNTIHDTDDNYAFDALNLVQPDSSKDEVVLPTEPRPVPGDRKAKNDDKPPKQESPASGGDVRASELERRSLANEKMVEEGSG